MSTRFGGHVALFSAEFSEVSVWLPLRLWCGWRQMSLFGGSNPVRSIVFSTLAPLFELGFVEKPGTSRDGLKVAHRIQAKGELAAEYAPIYKLGEKNRLQCKGLQPRPRVTSIERF